MQYDPIKNFINNFIKKKRFIRKLFYIFLDIFILRQWYVKKAINKYIKAVGVLGVCDLQPTTTIFYDAGAGFGQYSDFVLNKYKKSYVFALDLNDDFLADYYNSLHETKKNRFTYLKGDLTNFIFKESIGAISDSQIVNCQFSIVGYMSPCPEPVKADMIIAIDILEHIEDDISVLKNFYSSMNEGGLLIITTPSEFDKNASFTEEHVRPGYSMVDLVRKVESSGFQIIEKKYTYGFWGNLYWWLIMKNSLMMLNLSKLFSIALPFYMIIIFIPALVFMILDVISNNKSGNGILLIAKQQ